MRKKAGRLAFVFGTIFLAAVAQADTIAGVSVGRVFNVGFSVATDPFVDQPDAAGQPPSYAASLSPQSALISVPQFDHSLGRLNSMALTLDLLSVDSTVTETIFAAPGAQTGTHGGHSVKGTFSLFAHGVKILSTNTGSEISPAACFGLGTISCTHTGGFSARTITAEDVDPTLAFVLAAFDQLSVEGFLGSTHDLPDAATYSGTWKFFPTLIAEFDYTPVSEVPLPGAVWLFLSAITGLGLVRFRRRTGRAG